LRIDLHNHTPLCNHATGTPIEFLQKAIEQKIDIFGFSDHAPIPNNFDSYYRMSLSQIKNYENEILNLKEQFNDKIEVLLGYEVDFFKDKNLIYEEILNANVDYLIGSVHFLDNWGFDNPKFLAEYKNKDIDKIYEDYFDAINHLAKSGYFQIVGHLDLIKVFNFLPKKDIRIIAKEAIKTIKKYNLVVEINSAGLRKPVKEQYPSNKLLELILEYNIDICFGSDAHSIEQIGFKSDGMIQLAKKIGFSKQIYFKNKEKVKVNL